MMEPGAFAAFIKTLATLEARAELGERGPQCVMGEYRTLVFCGYRPWDALTLAQRRSTERGWEI